MRFIVVTIALLTAAVMALHAAPAQAAGPLRIVAAENVYGGIARDIAGPAADVVSILNSPDQDPHLFEASPAVVRQIADAHVVIFNGAHYDHWIENLLEASPRAKRTVIEVAKLTGTKDGDNPHLWFAPETMPKVARAIAGALAKADPANTSEYETRLTATLASLKRVQDRAAAMRARWAGVPVTATEPVFGPMADALGLTMRNMAFQTAMMNDTEPSARDIAAFEDDLKQRKVKVLIHNSQVSEKLTDRLVDIARKAKVPVVAVTETQPAGITYVDWILGMLGRLDKALAEPNS